MNNEIIFRDWFQTWYKQGMKMANDIFQRVYKNSNSPLPILIENIEYMLWNDGAAVKKIVNENTPTHTVELKVTEIDEVISILKWIFHFGEEFIARKNQWRINLSEQVMKLQSLLHNIQQYIENWTYSEEELRQWRRNFKE